MIIQWFAEMFFKVITGLLNWVNLPHIDPAVINNLSDYLFTCVFVGFDMFTFFVPKNVYTVCIPIVLLVTAFKYGYFFVMWILKKIPMAGVQ